ncbi:hypothetical protein ZWY2020_053321 [Hordeum vulgare]|nr:hypothetical protein ZWY2020_053321 [Hordeum vulgare]
MQNRNQLYPLDHPCNASQVYISHASLSVSYIGLTHRLYKPARVTNSQCGGVSCSLRWWSRLRWRRRRHWASRSRRKTSHRRRACGGSTRGGGATTRCRGGPRRRRRGRQFNVFKENARYVHEGNKRQALQAGAQQVRRHDHGRVPAHVRRVRVRHHLSLSGGRQGGSGFRYADADNLPPAVDWQQKGAVTAIRIKASAGVAGRSRRSWRWRASTRSGQGSWCRCRAGAHGLRQRQQPGLRRRPHGLRLPVHPEERDHHRVNYPYQGEQGSCDQAKENAQAVTIDGYEDVPANDESALQKAVAGQPVSVAIDASGQDFSSTQRVSSPENAARISTTVSPPSATALLGMAPNTGS